MATGQLGDSAQPVVTVQHLPGGEVYAVVADPAATAHTSVSADRSSVTVSVRLNGGMPCSIIFPDYVATQAFGPDFAAYLSSVSAKRSGQGGDTEMGS